MHYFVAQIKLGDKEEYQKYIHRADEIFKRYNGQYLAVDNRTEVIEGNWDYSRTVIIQFESKKDFESWYYSGDYQKIIKHRLKGAECDSILVEGLK